MADAEKPLPASSVPAPAPQPQATPAHVVAPNPPPAVSKTAQEAPRNNQMLADEIKGIVQELLQEHVNSARSHAQLGGAHDPGPELGAGRGAAIRHYPQHHAPQPHIQRLAYALARYPQSIQVGSPDPYNIPPPGFQPYSPAMKVAPPYHGEPTQPYVDQFMMENYRQKMDMLHAQFNSSLRPKLESLKRQVVLVEGRINEISSARDYLVAEANSNHQVHLDQIQLCAERKFAFLRKDLDDLMADVQRIHAFSSTFSQPHPQSASDVWNFMSHHRDLMGQCTQLASKGFKTSLDVSAEDLKEDVRSMIHPYSAASSLPKESAAKQDATNAVEELEEMKKLMKVKDQMVWLMLKERAELQQSLDNKTKALEDLEKSSVQEQEEWNKVCEGLQAKALALKKENDELKDRHPSQSSSISAAAGLPAATGSVAASQPTDAASGATGASAGNAGKDAPTQGSEVGQPVPSSKQ